MALIKTCTNSSTKDLISISEYECLYSICAKSLITKEIIEKSFKSNIFRFDKVWTNIETKTLGTFLTICYNGSFHFIPLRMNCFVNDGDFEFENGTLYIDIDMKMDNMVLRRIYEFPCHTIIFSPENPFEFSDVLRNL